MKDMFCYSQEISVCEKNRNLYICSDEIELMEDLHHHHQYFLHLIKKHWDILCNNLTHITTLST